MHKLSRQVKFAVEPFGRIVAGNNSYCAKPAANSLAMHLCLAVELAAQANPDTGFVMNVVQIDKILRKEAVPVIQKFIKRKFADREAISFERAAAVLKVLWQKTEKKFRPAEISGFFLQPCPAQKIGIRQKEADMFYYSEKFEFSASHTLWHKKFSAAKNKKIFGKCANPAGHGHNYIIDVCIKKPLAGGAFQIGNFEKAVKKGLIDILDHKNLNIDVRYFADINPTVENIAEFAYKKLEGRFGKYVLDSITVWESGRTSCCYKPD